MLELDDFARTVAMVTGPLRERLTDRGYRVVAVQNGASSHLLHIFVENQALGFCVTWDWWEVRCAAYPASQRGEWWRWEIGPEALARWRGDDAPETASVDGLLARVGELEALARDLVRWQDVRRGRLPRDPSPRRSS